MSTYYSGDTAPFLVTCKIGSTPYVIEVTDTVQAAFIDAATAALITAAVTQSSATAGADWAAGVVAVAFDGTEAAKLSAYANSGATLEIQVTKATGKQTFQAGYKIKAGVIP